LIRGTKKGEAWILRVSDNGRGIKDADLSRIQTALSRVDSGATNLDDEASADTIGLGIMNTFRRLKIIFGDRLVFRIENAEVDGAEVTIQVNGPERPNAVDSGSLPKGNKRN
jgi:two-component system sensor histidine kinase YesM